LQGAVPRLLSILFIVARLHDHALCRLAFVVQTGFIVDAHDNAWARNMKRLLQETYKKISVCTEK
jgi:hypothetical protein